MKKILISVLLVAVGIGIGVGWFAALNAEPRIPTDTNILYLRDAYGRCLRMQLKPLINGELFVRVMSNDACVKREHLGAEQK